jgi:hypothetical protein
MSLKLGQGELVIFTRRKLRVFGAIAEFARNVRVLVPSPLSMGEPI